MSAVLLLFRWFLLFETGAHPLLRSRTHYVAQTGLELAAIHLRLPSVRIMGMSHHAWLLPCHKGQDPLWLELRR